MPPPLEPPLAPEERAALAAAARQFNEGLYFECHDTLEELWSGMRGEIRDFFQGLIQVAVGHYHLGNGNAPGAASMFERALARFARYPPRVYGFDLELQRAELHDLLGRLAHDPGGLASLRPPRWSFEPPASAGS
jgi:predicted metal-dependent hydrolase